MVYRNLALPRVLPGSSREPKSDLPIHANGTILRILTRRFCDGADEASF
jgi:hypothetical protein